MTVKKEGKSNNLQAKLENGAKRGLILAGQVVAQRAQDKAHVVTGRLKRSITRGNPFAISSHKFGIKVGTNVEYAETEEKREGTKDGTPHAFLGPALEESRQVVRTLILKNIIAAIKK